MINAKIRNLLIAASLGCVLAGPAFAAPPSDNVQTVSGITIYVGFMPAKSVHRLAASATEPGMHEVNPGTAHGEHVTVALFDASNGARISNAHVDAAVGELGCGDTWKVLQPMNVSGMVTYGNYFDMPGGGKIYEIHVHIAWPGHGSARDAVFTHRVFD